MTDLYREQEQAPQGTQWWSIPPNWRKLFDAGHPFAAEFFCWLRRNDIYAEEVLDNDTFRVVRFTPHSPDKYIAYYTSRARGEGALMQKSVRVMGFPPTYKEDNNK